MEQTGTILPKMTIQPPAPTKLYSPNQVLLGSFWGGPIAAIYYLRENFIGLGETEAAQKTVAMGGIFIILLLGLIPLLPQNFPSIVIPLLYCIGAKQIALSRQMGKHAISESAGHTFQTNGRTFGTGTVCLAVFLIIATLVMTLFASLGLIEVPGVPATPALTPVE